MWVSLETPLQRQHCGLTGIPWFSPTSQSQARLPAKRPFQSRTRGDVRFLGAGSLHCEFLLEAGVHRGERSSHDLKQMFLISCYTSSPPLRKEGGLEPHPSS